MAQVLNQMPGQNTPSRPQGGASQPNPAAPRGGAKVDEFRPLDGPQMPSGWLNSPQGSKWLEQRVEAFSVMSGHGQMHFGFTEKKK